MVVEVLSKRIDEIFASLNIQSQQPVSFQSWLEKVHSIVEPIDSSLSIFNTATNQTSFYESSHKKASIPQPNNHQTNLIECEFEIPPLVAKLSLNLTNNQSDTWLSLKNFLEQSLELGVRHQLAIELNHLQASTFDQMKVGLISIKQGEIQQLNDYALKLIAKKHLRFKEDGLQLKEHSLNDLLTNKPFYTWLDKDTRFQAHIVKSQTQPLQWQTLDTCSWLIIKVLSFKPNVQWLMDLLNLTESEAKVASYACQGFSAKEISRDAHLSTHTVYSYLKSTYKKLGIKNQTQLASVIWPRLPI